MTTLEFKAMSNEHQQVKFKDETLQIIQTFFNREIIHKFDYIIIIQPFHGMLSSGYKKMMQSYIYKYGKISMT